MARLDPMMWTADFSAMLGTGRVEASSLRTAWSIVGLLQSTWFLETHGATGSTIKTARVMQ